MVSWKHGAGTAERLAGKLAEIADAERTGEVAEWLLEYEDRGRAARTDGAAVRGRCSGRPSLTRVRSAETLAHDRTPC